MSSHIYEPACPFLKKVFYIRSWRYSAYGSPPSFGTSYTVVIDELDSARLRGFVLRGDGSIGAEVIPITCRP